MRETSWPSLCGWQSTQEKVPVRRAVYGKVHRAPTDFRWIGWSSSFGSVPPERTDINVGIEEFSAVRRSWRCSPSTGAMAIHYYPSRAFDATGRPGGTEKQMLGTTPALALHIPPAALAFLLLPRAEFLNDTVWWDKWEDSAWVSTAYFLPLPEEPGVIASQDDLKNQTPSLSLADLDDRIEAGVAQLLKEVSDESLTHFYAQVLSSRFPAVLYADGAPSSSPPLSPLAMAALLLPLDRAFTENFSILGGILAPGLNLATLSNWNAVVIDRNIPMPALETADPVALDRARLMVADLHRAQANRGALPVPWSVGGKFLEGFCSASARWIFPGETTNEGLSRLGPWPLAQSGTEVAALRTLVREWIAREVHPTAGAARRQLEIKADLLRALLLVLCPGEATLNAVGGLTTALVPPLYFLERLKPSEWDSFAAAFQEETLFTLVDDSSPRHIDSSMYEPVMAFFQKAEVAQSALRECVIWFNRPKT